MFHLTFVAIFYYLILSTVNANLGLKSNFTSTANNPSNLVKLFNQKSFLWESLEQLNFPVNVSSQCANSIHDILDRFQKSDMIGLKMVDSSGRFPSGFLDGTLSDFGDFDECLAIRYHSNESGGLNHQITGKHCMVKMKPILNADQYKAFKSSWMVINDFPINIAMCVPSECSSADIKLLLTKALQTAYRITDEPFCDEPISLQHLPRLTTGQMVSIAYMLTMIIIITAASLTDFYLRIAKRKAVTLISNFSALAATLDLLSADNERFKTRKKTIDLMRFVWVVIIIAAHASFGGIEPRVIYKTPRLDVDIPKFFSPLHNQPLFNAAVIEGFFYIGGFVTYVSMHSALFKQNVSLIGSAINRCLRYLPGVLSLMAVEQIWPLLAYGPMSAEVRSSIYTNCANNWWKNILFINNFDGLVNMCLTHTWYISADIQLFILSLIVMAILRWNRTIGVSVIYFMIMLGMALTGLTAYSEHHIPAIILANKDWWGFLDFIDYSYLPTTPHITPYFMGVLIGYYSKNDVQILNKSLNAFLWFFCPTIFIIITFMPSLWNTYKWEPQQYHSAAIYLTFYRFLWTAAFAWAISILTKYVIKVVSYMKEAAGMKKTPIRSADYGPSRFEVTSLILGVARLHFSIYLVHSVYVRWYYTTSRHHIPFDSFDIGERTVLMTGMSILASFFFFILFEGPFENIRTCIFKKTID